MAIMLHSKPIDILLVEDNPADALLTEEALHESKVANRLYHVGDGEAAIAFLRDAGPDKSNPLPGIILLDLNLPRMDGRAVLREIKADPRLKTIPVVILTTSEAEEDIVRSYELHANCYVTKPVDLEKFLQIVRMIEDFWLSIVKLPDRAG